MLARVRALRAIVSLAGLIAVACGSADDRPTPTLADTPGITRAIDKDPDPAVFETDLEARESTVEYVAGKKTKVWTYNGVVPGPLIDVKVGTKLVVHFKNSLPQATTIHWHGIRLPNAMDGAVAVQDPVPPGGTFEYAFTLRDAGLYWFHPHHFSDSQTAKGMYGVIRVRGPNEPTSDDESVVVLDDARLEADGSLPKDLDDWEQLPIEMKLHGRSGPIILVNGAANRTIEVRAGELHRFRFLNAANLRYFNLRMPGHRWRVIGTDGSLFERPYDSENLLIGPAERYDALLIPNASLQGQEISLLSDAYQRAEDDPQEATTVAKLRVSDTRALSGRAMPDAIPGVGVPRLAIPPGDPLPIVFDFGTIGGPEGFTFPASHHGEMPPAEPGDPIFAINKKVGDDIPALDVPLGETRVFKISNTSHQIHLFHLHGFFFQIVDSDDKWDAKKNPLGLRPELMAQANKDTVTVREGYSVTIVGRFDAPGTWMYHCHIPEHSERGMMAEIHVK